MGELGWECERPNIILESPCFPHVDLVEMGGGVEKNPFTAAVKDLIFGRPFVLLGGWIDRWPCASFVSVKEDYMYVPYTINY